MTRGADIGPASHDLDGHNARQSADGQGIAGFSRSLPSSSRPSTASERNGHHEGETESDDDHGLHMAPINGQRRSRPSLERAVSDVVNSQVQADSNGKSHERESMRHGWESQLENEEVMRNLSDNFFMYYLDKRHETGASLPPDWRSRGLEIDWRMKDRLKTVSAFLAVCLNVGVDPPDVIKTDPCARLECWVDPKPPENVSSHSQSNTNATIGKNLQQQYENLSLRTRYKVTMDPTTDELRKTPQALRKNAHAERLLFHYNGHGVPKPTKSGEIWCFNKSYTQYIPVSLYDLAEWMGAPGLWVWDCSAAGGIITGFLDAVKKHADPQEKLQGDPARAQQHAVSKYDDCIHLAACRHDEVLPTNPRLPADLFTSCLTTPIMMAVRFFILQHPIPSMVKISLEDARKIPGKISERRTPLGELNWIFTAITDTIAWNCLPKPLFKKLFRQDLMVAALFRNFLLAQRVMRMYHCHPQSHPALPDTHHHYLWDSWDLAVELMLFQMPKLLQQQKKIDEALATAPSSVPPMPQPELEYEHSSFFADQLTAFDLYLSLAPADPSACGYGKAPEQLPIVLQVLLSQVHRLRALVLLSKFLDLGPWAVNLALSIGIFPYVVKLLQSQAVELKAPMVFIWARILAVDQTCQSDLLKDSGYTYFTNILNSTTGIPNTNIAEHRAMCTFVIAMLCRDFQPGKVAVLENTSDLIEHCLNYFTDWENPILRQFSLLCLSNLCRDYAPAKAVLYSKSAYSRIGDCSHDPVPEVRAACLHALTSYIATSDDRISAPRDEVRQEEEILVSVILTMGMDGSIMVRKELTILYSEYVLKHCKRFIVAAWDQLLEELDKKVGKLVDPDDFVLMDGQTSASAPSELHQENGINGHSSAQYAQKARNVLGKKNTQTSRGTVYRAVWRTTLSLSADPHPRVAQNASVIVDYVFKALLESSLGPHVESVLEQLQSLKRNSAGAMSAENPRARENRPETPPSPVPSTASKGSDYFGLSRTASVAAAMKNFMGWGAKTPAEVSRPPSPSSMRRTSIHERSDYRSRPLTPGDAAMLPELPPNALDNIAGPPHQAPAKVPPAPNFRARDLTEEPTLPLVSDFFDLSAAYFREPQMRLSEADEPGSREYNQRLWRRNRNDKIIASTQPMKEAARSNRWDVPCGYFGIGAAPVRMVFHQFENHLVTSDDRDSIAVWDWEKAEQLSRFSNSNPPGSRVTDIRFINEDDTALLMTGSSDGVIKIYRRYDDLDNMELVSGFRALSELLPSDKQNAGLVFDWQQGQGKVLVAGDDRVIRVWQVGQELCVADVPARSSSCITSLTSDQVEGHVFVAGFGNGGVRVYDQRLRAHDSMIMDWTDRRTDHRSWIVGVHLQRGGLRELVSAESNGGIRLWDIRMRRAVHGITPPTGSAGPRNLRSLSVHEHAPVIATGGKDHAIRVYNTDLKQLSSFEPYMSYLRLDNRPRNAPITATAFHPHRMMLACGAVNDGHVNLFKLDAPDIGRRGVGATGSGSTLLNGGGSMSDHGGSVVEEWI